MAVAVVYQKDAADTWVDPVGAGGGDATLRTSQTCTIGSHISVTAGDMVDFFLAWGDNYASTSPTFTQASATFGTVAEQPATALSTADGYDGAMDGGYRLCTAGTSSAAAVVTATFGNSEQGGAWQTRLRVTGGTAVANDDVMVMAVAAVGGTTMTVAPPGPVWSNAAHWDVNYDQYCVAYGGGYWVSIGAGRELNTSSDGAAWTENTSITFSIAMRAVAYDVDNGRWLAGGNAGELYTATDPTGTWTQQTSPFGANPVSAIAWGNGLWVVICGTQMATSSNGTSWTLVTGPATKDNSNNALIRANGIWVFANLTYIYTATDPAGTWTQRVDVTSWGWVYPGFTGLAYGNGLWVGVGRNGGLATAVDPTGTWTNAGWIEIPIATTSRLYAVAYGNNMWLAVGTIPVDASVWVAWSWDGINWISTRNPSRLFIPNAVGYGAATWVWVGSEGDLNYATALTKSACWIPLGSAVNSTTALKQRIFWKIASSEPSSYAVSISPTNKASGVIIALSGASVELPIGAQYAGQANASSTTVTAPTLGSWGGASWGITNGIDLGLFCTAAQSSFTPPADYTEPAGADSASTTGTTSEGCYRALTAVTTVGSIAAAAVDAAANIGHHVFIKESSVFAPEPPQFPYRQHLAQ
jgi:hypothetical protein